MGPLEDPHGLFNGWGCASRGAGAGLATGAFFLLLFCSQVIASEAASGAMRTTLSAPIRRIDVFFAKALWCLLWAVLVFAVAWAVSWGAGAILFGYGDVTESLRFGDQTALFTHHDGAKMGSVLLRTVAASLPPMIAVAFLGLAASFLAVRPAQAMVGALAVYLPVEVFLTRFCERLSPYLFSTYTHEFNAALGEFARGLSTAQLPASGLLHSLLSSLGASILFLSASLIYFVVRDVTE